MALLSRLLHRHPAVQVVEVRRQLVSHPPVLPADHSGQVRRILLSSHLSLERYFRYLLEVAELLDAPLILLDLVNHVLLSMSLLSEYNLPLRHLLYSLLAVRVRGFSLLLDSLGSVLHLLEIFLTLLGDECVKLLL